jgi:hypothetical protein
LAFNPIGIVICRQASDYHKPGAVLGFSFYECRPVTFAVWTNAAMISHRHPLVTVTMIEAAIVALIAGAVWLLLDLVAYHLRDWLHLLNVIYGRKR